MPTNPPTSRGPSTGAETTASATSRSARRSRDVTGEEPIGSDVERVSKGFAPLIVNVEDLSDLRHREEREADALAEIAAPPEVIPESDEQTAIRLTRERSLEALAAEPVEATRGVVVNGVPMQVTFDADGKPDGPPEALEVLKNIAPLARTVQAQGGYGAQLPEDPSAAIKAAAGAKEEARAREEARPTAPAVTTTSRTTAS